MSPRGSNQRGVIGCRTRRDLLKGGGGAVLVGLAGSSTNLDAAGASTTAAEAGSCTPVPGSKASTEPAFRPGGAGPLYWSTYGYEFFNNTLIPEEIWKTNVDWVAETFREYGYTMVCTDGWIDNTQRITPTATSGARLTTGCTNGPGGPPT